MGTMSIRHALEAFTTETVVATKTYDDNAVVCGGLGGENFFNEVIKLSKFA